MYYIMVTTNGKITCQGAYSHEFAVYAKKARLKKQDPYRQIDIVKSNQMPRRTKEDNSGWPKHIKNTKDREKSIAKKMKGQMFEDVTLKGDNKVIHWNTIKRVWRKND